MNKPRIIISGGGTGGHIFPALSIAGSIKELCPEADILFVGAEGKMEMERVPAAGYKIIGLPVAGLQRKLSLQNLALPGKVAKSIRKAGDIIRTIAPGVGGKGGGKPDSAMGGGSDLSRLDEALAAVKGFVEEHIK